MQTESETPCRRLRRLEREPHVRAAERWLKKEKSRHFGALCLPLGDDLYLTAKGFALHTGTATDVLPPIPDSYPLLRLSRRRVALMKNLCDNFDRRQRQRDTAIREISRQPDISYAGALEISKIATLGTYAAYLLCLPAAPLLFYTINLHLLYRWRWFRAGSVQKVDPILAQVGCQPGRTATTKQLSEALFQSSTCAHPARKSPK